MSSISVKYPYDLKVSGVYKITSPNGNVYIGQSSNIRNRTHSHKRDFKLGKKFALYNSFNKYGIDKHILDVLFISDDSNSKTRMEQFYINYYNSKEDGLNMIYADDISNGFKGKKHSKEEVDKIRKRMRGFVPEKAIKSRMKMVLCGKNNKKYESISECAKDLGFSQAYISNMANGKGINRFNIKFI